MIMKYVLSSSFGRCGSGWVGECMWSEETT